MVESRPAALRKKNLGYLIAKSSISLKCLPYFTRDTTADVRDREMFNDRAHVAVSLDKLFRLPPLMNARLK
jgi:hypothetical protein